MNKSNEGSIGPESSKADSLKEKPIVKVLLRILSSPSTDPTLLTNADLLDILQDELAVDVSQLDKIQRDIYLSVIKTFMKTWPQWDALERDFKFLSQQFKNDDMAVLLQSKYQNIKSYLRNKLSMAMIMEAALEEEVVLEVGCTRPQLNQLVLSRPTCDMLFNREEPERHSFTQGVTYNAILNWGGFSVFMRTKNYTLVRHTNHKFKHSLVQVANPDNKNTFDALNTKLQEKHQYSFKWLQTTKLLDELRSAFRILYLNVEKDFEMAPKWLKYPASYRRNFAKYPYTRHLFKDNTENKDDDLDNKHCDIRIEESICPMYLYQLQNASTDQSDKTENVIVKIVCDVCDIGFDCSDAPNPELIAHFLECRHKEPDWVCWNCSRNFDMQHLAKNRWHHEC